MNSVRLLAISVLFPFISNAQNTISTVAGTGTVGYGADNIPATSSPLYYNTGDLVVASSGDMYYAEGNRIRKVDGQTGIVTTIAGSDQAGYSGDGGPATDALFYEIEQLALAPNGDLYIADAKNNRVRKISLATGIVTTVAGNGNLGFDGEGIPATDANVGEPDYIAIDHSGNLYISQFNGGKIRKVDAQNGTIKTIAGTGTLYNTGDGGPALNAQIGFGPMAFDGADNLYFFSFPNKKLRRIDVQTGIITHVAGTGASNPSGDGGPASTAGLSWQMQDIAVDNEGNIYLPHPQQHSRIRKIDVNGNINTIVGTGTPGFTPDGIDASISQLNDPVNITLDSCGNLFITDRQNYRIRKVTYTECTPTGVKEVATTAELNIYPNPVAAQLNIESDVALGDIVVNDITGRIILQRTVNSEQITVDVSALAGGVYFVRVGGNVVKFVKE